jgi:hypothetical protein
MHQSVRQLFRHSGENPTLWIVEAIPDIEGKLNGVAF